MTVGAVAIASCLAGGVPAASAALPPIHHVFVIVLENEGAASTFGSPPPAPYLATTMRAAGAYLPNYYGIGHASLDNYIAMISGQAPNQDTQSDCPTFLDVSPDKLAGDGQEDGVGCVYPTDVPTIASQLSAAGLTWGAYEESMGTDLTREASVCGHPAIAAPDNTEGGETSAPYDEYATRHDPFMYFHSIIDTSLCNQVVNLDQLPAALQQVSTTPNYVFITPDLCGDGHDNPCKNPSRPGGYAGINDFLSTWVPMITASPAYMKDGLLIVVFDEALDSDASSCCGEMPGPNAALPGGTGPGGGDTGAVLMSPFITPGTVSTVAYNHYSMLGSVEDIFGLSRLGYAADTTPFGSDVFAPSGPSIPPASTITTSTTTTTTGSVVPTPRTPTSRPAPSCVIPKLPRAKHHKVATGALLRAIAIVHSRGRAAVTLTAVRRERLRLSVRPRRGKRHPLASVVAVPCGAYAFSLPRGHGTVTIRASVTSGAATVSRTY